MESKLSFIEFAKEEIAQSWLNAQARIKNNDLLIALTAVICMVFILIVIGSLNNKVVPLYPLAHYHYNAEPANPLSMLSNWDGPNYLRIARFNYRTLFDAGYFPLYPALIYFLTFIFRSPLMSALLLSWISLVGALYFYIKILRRLGSVTNGSEAVKAITFFLLFPTGAFLLVTYTESLFSLLSLSAILLALEKRWFATLPLLILVATAHEQGLFVAGLIALILIEQKLPFLKALPSALSGIIGLGSFMFFLRLIYHNPVAFVASQTKIHSWGYFGLGHLLASTNIFDALSVLLVLLGALYYWKRRRSFSFYTLSFMAIPLLGGQYGGFNRYVLTAFPIEFMLYEYFKDHPRIYPYIMALAGILWTIIALEYTGGYIGS